MKKYAALVAVLSVVVLSMFITGCQVKEVTSAKVYIQQDNWDKAMEQLQLAVELYPTNAEAWFMLGQGYSRKNDFENMNMAFEKSLDASPSFAAKIAYERERYYVNYFNNGHKRATSGMFEDAIEDFQTCITIDPTRQGSYKNLGYTYVQMGDLEKSIEFYEKAYELDPKDIDSMRSLNSLYLQNEQFEKVIEISDNILELDPTDTETVANKAIAYDFMGESDKAFETYDEALKLNPDDVDIIFNLGRLYYIGEDYENAIAQFKNWLKETKL